MIDIITISSHSSIYKNRYYLDKKVEVYDTNDNQTERVITETFLPGHKKQQAWIEIRHMDLITGQYIKTIKENIPRKQALKTLGLIDEKIKTACESTKTHLFSTYYFKD